MDPIHTEEIINESETIIKVTVDVAFGAFKTKKKRSDNRLTKATRI